MRASTIASAMQLASISPSVRQARARIAWEDENGRSQESNERPAGGGIQGLAGQSASADCDHRLGSLRAGND